MPRHNKTLIGYAFGQTTMGSLPLEVSAKAVYPERGTADSRYVCRAVTRWVVVDGMGRKY